MYSFCLHTVTCQNSSILNIQLSVKTIPFQVIQFSISTQFSSIWPIDRTLSGATTPSQRGHGSNGNEGVLRIPQSSSTAGTSLSDCLVWLVVGGVLPLRRDAVGVFYSPSRQGNKWVRANLYNQILLLLEKELFICIKMDLVLNNLQWLIYHKTKPNQIVNWFQVLLPNKNNSIWYQSFFAHNEVVSRIAHTSFIWILLNNTNNSIQH